MYKNVALAIAGREASDRHPRKKLPRWSRSRNAIVLSAAAGRSREPANRIGGL